MTSGPSSTRRNDPANYPHADSVVDDVVIYDCERLRTLLRTGSGRREMQSELAAAIAGRPRARRDGARLPRRIGRRPGDSGVRRDDRRAARRRHRGRGPFRQAGRERPGVERAGEAGPARAGGVRRLLRQRHPRARVHGLARARLPGDLAGQRGQSRGRRAAARTATTTSGSRPTKSPSCTRHMCTGSLRCSPCRVPSRTTTCRWRPGRRCTCRIPSATGPATWPGAAPSSASTSPNTTSSCRLPKATRCSSTRRCSTPPGTTTRRTSSGWRTCSRCPRRSAARWRVSTGRGWRSRCIRHCCAGRLPA